MLKKIAIATVTVFVVWSAMDYVIHEVILHSSYMDTAHLWRPFEKMKSYMPWMSLLTLVYAAIFSVIYGLFVNPKSIATGGKFGFLFGLAAGLGMGFGSYLVMPITLFIAFTWMVGTIAEMALAGVIAGAIIKSD